MTINEIAELAGVSRATVSRYLNDGYVSEEKKQRIRKVIEETGYTPSIQAQTLRSKKTRLIGVIIPKINSESISKMVAGIGQVLKKEGYQLLLADTENQEKEEIKYLRVFSENQVDGIILLGTILTNTHKKLMQELRVPIAVIGQKLEGYSCVYQEDYEAAKEITTAMVNGGVQKVGYLGVTTKDAAVGTARRQGFLDALAQAEVKVSEEWMIETKFQVESGYEKARELLEKEPQIDSIFCATDNIALGAMMYLNEQGIQIPEKIQLVGMGDSTMSKVAQPQLTTVHFYYEKSGMEVAKQLVELISQKDGIKKQIKMGYELVQRGSIRSKK